MQGNRLTPEIDCDDTAGRGGSRDFSQGLNRAWPPERSSVFFSSFLFLPLFEELRRYLARYLHASIPEKRKEKYCRRGEGENNARRKNGRLREESRVGKEIHARGDSACTFSNFVSISSALADPPFPSLRHPLAQTARVRNRGKGELIVGKTPFSP